ncbi:MAG: EthD family reductase [Anaerolineae bacterium]|nr:EthD family reductase [Anaerolineae bacterium]
MVKFSILFRKPTNDKRFENAYNDFLALVERMPNIQRRQVNSVLGSPLGETSFYRILEIYFEDSEQMDASLRSPAGQEAGGELQRLPSGSFEIYFAEVYEEAGGSTTTS